MPFRGVADDRLRREIGTARCPDDRRYTVMWEGLRQSVSESEVSG